MIMAAVAESTFLQNRFIYLERSFIYPLFDPFFPDSPHVIRGSLHVSLMNCKYRLKVLLLF